MKNIAFCLFICMCLIGLTAFLPTQQGPSAKFGALAVDRSNGFYYGFSHDYATRAEAETRAQEECRKKGGNCSVVLVWQGTGCAAYRTIDGEVGTAYGWGVAATRAGAEAIASRELQKRANGRPANNFVWACNSAGSPFKEVYNDRQAPPESLSPDAKSAAKEFLSFNGKTTEASGDCPGMGTASVTADDESFLIIINNLGSGANQAVTSKFYTEGCTSCLSVQAQDINNEKIYVATSGSLSQTGNTITLNVTVKDLESVVTGGGTSYKVSATFTCED